MGQTIRDLFDFYQRDIVSKYGLELITESHKAYSQNNDTDFAISIAMQDLQQTVHHPMYVPRSTFILAHYYTSAVDRFAIRNVDLFVPEQCIARTSEYDQLYFASRYLESLIDLEPHFDLGSITISEEANLWLLCAAKELNFKRDYSAWEKVF